MNDNLPRINSEVKEIIEKGRLENAFEIIAQQSCEAFKGTVLEGKPCKYTVLSHKDLDKYIDVFTQNELWVMIDSILGNIENAREKDNKKPYNSYIVINTDEPYINEIVEVMKQYGQWDGKIDIDPFKQELNFYEAYNPYYALILAKNEEEAYKVYIENVADDDGDLHEEIELVDREYGIVKFSRGKSEDGELLEISEILEDLKSDKSKLLLIDGSLI